MFRVGQKIVCVDPRGANPCLQKGRIYLCVGVEENFIGVDCCCDGYHPSHRWFPSRFRPIVERKTDISVFKKMLTPAGRENADAQA